MTDCGSTTTLYVGYALRNHLLTTQRSASIFYYYKYRVDSIF